jgi:hypothetical protein
VRSVRRVAGADVAQLAGFLVVLLALDGLLGLLIYLVAGVLKLGIVR